MSKTDGPDNDESDNKNQQRKKELPKSLADAEAAWRNAPENPVSRKGKAKKETIKKKLGGVVDDVGDKVNAIRDFIEEIPKPKVSLRRHRHRHKNNPDPLYFAKNSNGEIQNISKEAHENLTKNPKVQKKSGLEPIPVAASKTLGLAQEVSKSKSPSKKPLTLLKKALNKKTSNIIKQVKKAKKERKRRKNK